VLSSEAVEVVSEASAVDMVPALELDILETNLTMTIILTLL
jgi:hypothetical protein